MRLIISVLLLFLLGCSSIEYTDGEVTGLDKYIIERLEKSNKPGFTGMVLEGDRIVWTGQYGYKDLGKKLPVNKDTPFIIASISKLITSALLMDLVEDGLVNLDDDVNKYLGFEVRNPNYPNTPITIKMLLNHSSSISMDFPRIWFTKAKEDSVMEIKDFLYEYLTPGGKYNNSKCYSNFEPGTSFSYSNPGITLIAHIIEIVTSKSLEKASRERIFNPLEMNKTSWLYSHYDKDEVAKPYTKFLIYKSWGYYNFPIYPAFSLKSTPEDISKFFNSFFYNKNSFLNNNTKEKMFQIQKGIKPIYWDKMGLTWQHKTLEEGYELIGHTGGLFGMSSLAFYCKENNRTVIFFMNGSWQTGKSYDRFKDESIREVFIRLLTEDFE